MKIILPLLINISLFLNIDPLSAREQVVFTADNHSIKNPVASVSKISCSVSNGRALLKWNIANNQSADRIEIESSPDGKNFHMVGLVFGTDKENTDDYSFAEKTKPGKIFYRLKVINKDKSVHYSEITTP